MDSCQKPFLIKVTGVTPKEIDALLKSLMSSFQFNSMCIRKYRGDDP